MCPNVCTNGMTSSSFSVARCRISLISGGLGHKIHPKVHTSHSSHQLLFTYQSCSHQPNHTPACSHQPLFTPAPVHIPATVHTPASVHTPAPVHTSSCSHSGPCSRQLLFTLWPLFTLALLFMLPLPCQVLGGTLLGKLVRSLFPKGSKDIPKASQWAPTLEFGEMMLCYALK